MPGPSGTESRWAPRVTTRSARPPRVSAITLRVVFFTCSWSSSSRTLTSPFVAAAVSASPSASVMPALGMIPSAGEENPPRTGVVPLWL